jgi:hypothetical protein
MGWPAKFPNALINGLCAPSPIRATRTGVESPSFLGLPRFLFFAEVQAVALSTVPQNAARRREHVRQIGHFGALRSIFR